MPSDVPSGLRRAVAVAAWLVLAVIAVSTVVPLDLRPESGLPTIVERFGAFALMGLLFALAYPRRILLVLLLILCAAGGLELLQTVAIHRHARISDAQVKLVGGLAGLVAGWAAQWLAGLVLRLRRDAELDTASEHRS